MLNEKALQKQTLEIELLIRYAVAETELQPALDFLRGFYTDSFALDVIQDYYRTLPEAREEPLLKISVLEKKEQVILLLLSTNRHHYFYLANDEEGLFLGEWEKGFSDPQVLAFFGYPHQDAFTRQHQSPDICQAYVALERANEDICPSCGAESGSLHILGCPVEVCPWCGGQLSRCNCRFEQLDVEELIDEKMLDELEARLEKKGRVPYAREQRPSFLVESDVA